MQENVFVVLKMGFAPRQMHNNRLHIRKFLEETLNLYPGTELVTTYTSNRTVTSEDLKTLFREIENLPYKSRRKMIMMCKKERNRLIRRKEFKVDRQKESRTCLHL